MQTAQKRLYLDAIVMGKKSKRNKARLQGGDDTSLSMKKIYSFLEHGADTVFRSGGVDVASLDLDALLRRSERLGQEAHQKMKNKIAAQAQGKKHADSSEEDDDDDEDEGEGIASFFSTPLEQVERERQHALKEQREAERQAEREQRRLLAKDPEAQAAYQKEQQAEYKTIQETNVLSGGRVRKRPKLYEPEDYTTVSSGRVPLKHEEYCFLCKDGGLLVTCLQCPHVYHAKCVGYDSEADIPNFWRCPWHHCQTCQRSKTTAGGVLFLCVNCPRSLCYECWDESKNRRTVPSNR